MITRDELIEMERQLDTSKVWNGQGWTQHPVHPFKYNKVLAIIRREIDLSNKELFKEENK